MTVVQGFQNGYFGFKIVQQFGFKNICLDGFHSNCPAVLLQTQWTSSGHFAVDPTKPAQLTT